MNLKQRARQLKTDLPALFLCIKHRSTPPIAKFFALLTVGYALSPIDLIPDFIPVLGYLDDVLLLPALIALTIRCIPAEVFAQCRSEAAGLWAEGRPKRWYYALPVLLLWILVILWAAKAFGLFA